MRRVLMIGGQEYDLELATVKVSTPLGNMEFRPTSDLIISVITEDASVNDALLDKLVMGEEEIETIAPKTATMNIGTIGASDQSEEEAQQQFLAASQPAKGGILPLDKTPMAGKRRQLTEDELRTLKQMRQDFEIVLVRNAELEKGTYKNLKKQVELKSPIFSNLSDESLRKGIHLLAVTEQQCIRTTDRNNLLYVETLPQLLFIEVEKETEGIGKFQFIEVVSVYENPETLYSKPDNGKDK